VQILGDRTSWSAQKEFFAELVKARDAQHDSPDRVEGILVKVCQAVGFGCKREVEPYVGLVQAELREMQVEHQRLLDGEAVAHPEIPALRIIDGVMKRIFASGAQAVIEEDPESVLFVNEVGPVLKAFPEGNCQYTMLWAAVRFGFPHAAMYFADDCDLNHAEPESGSTPLHMLWNLPDEFIVSVARYLVEKGARLESPSQPIGGAAFPCPKNMTFMTGTPLSWAIKAGNLVAITTLLLLGADPMNDDGAASTPLEVAVSLYQPDIVDMILYHLEENADLKEEDADGPVGQSIIMGLAPGFAHELERIAIHGTNIQEMAMKTVKTVLTHWPGDKNIFLQALLGLSVTSEHVSVITTLAPYLVQVLLKIWISFVPAPLPSQGLFILLSGIVRLWEREGENCAELLETLLQDFPHVLDLEAKDTQGRTALHIAAIHNTTPLISILLQHGAWLEAKDIDGYSPLGLAARMASTESFETLLDSGAQIFHPDAKWGPTSALHLAAIPQTQRSLIPYMLFESKYRALFTEPEMLEKVEGYTGLTALALCVVGKQLEAIQALMTAGANCRAACSMPAWPIVLSVRELATVIRYKPELGPGATTWQRNEVVDPEEQVSNSRTVQEIFYYGCKASDYEEEDFIDFDSSRQRGQQLVLKCRVRKTRTAEPFEAKYVSIDVLDRWSPKYGVSRWSENGLRGDESAFWLDFPAVVVPKSRTTQA
jgi:ankyrin repeat protein